MVNGTIFDDEETARQIALHINQNNPAHIMAWINDFKNSAPIANVETDGMMLAEEE